MKDPVLVHDCLEKFVFIACDFVYNCEYLLILERSISFINIDSNIKKASIKSVFSMGIVFLVRVSFL